MTTRSKKSLGSTGLIVLAFLFLAVTVLSNSLFRGVRLDLTENNLYTISDGTRNILDNIEEPINLYFFYSDRASENIPYLRTYARRVRELLQEFNERADGNIVLTEIDPIPFSEEEDRATGFELQAVSLGGTGDPIYFGLAATNAVDDLETIKFFQPDREAFLEYDLAKLINTLAIAKKPVVGLLSTLPVTGGYDANTGQPLEAWAVIAQLQQLFEVRNLDPAITTVDESVDLMVVIHPKSLTDKTFYAIDQFVMRGGKLLAFVDSISDADIPRDPAMASAALFEDRSSSLERLFNSWGFSANPDKVVLDQVNALSVNTGIGQPPTRHLAMVGIGADGLTRDDVVTSDLDSINMGSAGHITLTDDSELNVVPLIRSSGESGLIAASELKFLPDPTKLQENFVSTDEVYTLAARISGDLESAFPEGPPGDASEDEPLPEHIAATTGQANMIVVADTDMLTDRMWVQVQNFFGQRIQTAFAGNGAMALNAVENMTGSSDLIGVRSRGTFSRPFDRVEELRREADAAYLAEERSLQSELEATEQRLNELQSAKNDENVAIITPEQRAELLRFQEERLNIRKALRDVRHNLDRSIEDLGTRLKIINIGLVPFLLSILAIVFAVLRSRRRRMNQ
jgi:ABC-type uncharacterized transport system involved in gliding motility auxiliary subunit